MKKLLLALILSITFLSPFQVANTVAAFDPLDKACDAKVNSGGADQICDDSKTPTNPINTNDGIITAIANILSFVAAIIAVFIIIIAGITMMTSGGDSGKITSSRNAIIYTVIGLVVIVLARTIVVFVFNNIIN